ncbi:MAG: SAM-dependent methyltransferase [Chitinophagaceae bacterium]|nr:SAM-dependent methyltransferase [Chitinophagaceae bacterium]
MTPAKSIVYLIPAFLDENNAQVIPSYVLEAVKNCEVFFVENERSARRYLKSLWKEMVIDNYQWFLIDKHASNLTKNSETHRIFRQMLAEEKNIGVISEAGCPGIADPGQSLVDIAHHTGAIVKPLVGPSSILLALMASGMNGQQFQFVGYLPIDTPQRIKALKDLEQESSIKNCTQIFIETPYRNNQLLEILLKTCLPTTRICIAANLTASTEFIYTKTAADWKKKLPDLHKQPAIFLMHSGN